MSYLGSLKSLLVIVLGRAPHYHVVCTFQHYLIHSLQAAGLVGIRIFASQKKKML